MKTNLPTVCLQDHEFSPPYTTRLLELQHMLRGCLHFYMFNIHQSKHKQRPIFLIFLLSVLLVTKGPEYLWNASSVKLGVQLDLKLTLVEHVNMAINRSKKSLHAIRIIINILRKMRFFNLLHQTFTLSCTTTVRSGI